jgi:hypothetical protein
MAPSRATLRGFSLTSFYNKNFAANFDVQVINETRSSLNKAAVPGLNCAYQNLPYIQVLIVQRERQEVGGEPTGGFCRENRNSRPSVSLGIKYCVLGIPVSPEFPSPGIPTMMSCPEHAKSWQ